MEESREVATRKPTLGTATGPKATRSMTCTPVMLPVPYEIRSSRTLGPSSAATSTAVLELLTAKVFLAFLQPWPWQPTSGTQRMLEPVSNTTLNGLGGVPIMMSP